MVKNEGSSGSGRSSRCAPPPIVPSASSVPCSAFGNRRIEGALRSAGHRYLIGFSRRFVHNSPQSLARAGGPACPPCLSTSQRIVSHHTPMHPAPWGHSQAYRGGRGKFGSSEVTSLKPLAVNRRDLTTSTKAKPPMHCKFPITPQSPIPNVTLRRIAGYASYCIIR